MATCVCGHDADDEHGGDPEYPASTACVYSDPKTAKEAEVEVCDCVAYEWNGEGRA